MCANMPGNHVEGGLLSIRLIEARGLWAASGQSIVSTNGETSGSQGAESGGGGGARSKRESAGAIARRENAALPYVVMTFDKNEVVVDAIGGSLTAPFYTFLTTFDISRPAPLVLSAYLRTSSDPKSGGTTHRRAQSISTNDLFLASVVAEVEQDFVPLRVSDRWYQASNGAGEFRIQVAFRPAKPEPLTIDSFELLKVIGKGSFGKVMQVRKKDTGRIYALKTIRKAHIVSRSEVIHTLAERTVLATVNSAFIVPLKFSFQSPEKLYLVLAYVNGGELFHHLQLEGKFSEERTRFYTAELLSALDCLHKMDVVYRDLKPENILIDFTGHLVLCDFGLCKLNMSENERTNTFAGTPEYLSPELILGEGYSRTVDWWTLGVLMYEMLSGLPPFFEDDHQKMYRRIVEEPLTFPPTITGSARHLLQGLLQKDPADRLGSQGSGADEIRRHLFFYGLDWKKLERREYVPPFRPSVESAVDTSNVDAEFLEEPALDSVVEDSQLSESSQALFEGFSYAAPVGLLGESVR
ncbi:hypothetical protein JCM1840_003008 [Sporobolomyces johnsonii]